MLFRLTLLLHKNFLSFLIVLTVGTNILEATALPENLSKADINAVYEDDKNPEQIDDPLEPLNRVIFTLNHYLDNIIIAPAAYAFQEFLPDFVQESVGNFLNNIGEPIIFMNDLLQGEFDLASESLFRFISNSLFGIFGLLDFAADVGEIHAHEQDFGITLGRWGVKSGPYLVLPILGPSNFRDAIGRTGDYYADPYNWYMRTHDKDSWIYARAVANGVVKRQRILKITENLDQQHDPYTQYRALFMQHRNYLISGESDELDSPVPSDIE